MLVVALPYVEKWSRSPDPIGWIRCALAQLRLLATLRWAWREAEPGRGISVIKAVLPSCCLMRLLAGGDCVLAMRSGAPVVGDAPAAQRRGQPFQ